MEPADDASHESGSSQASFNFQFDVDSVQHNQETSANSCNDLLEEPRPNQQPQQSHHIITLGQSSIAVGLGPRVEHGPVHSGQHSHREIYSSHPNSGVGNFSQIGDLSLSLNVGSSSQYRTNTQLLTHKVINAHNSIPNTSHPPLFFHQNWAATATLNRSPLQASGQRGSLFPDGHAPQYHSPMPFRPQQFSFYPYSNISAQPGDAVDDPRGRHPVYHLGSRAPQIPHQRQLYNLVQMTQNYSTLGPPMASRLQFPPTHPLGSTIPRSRKNDESHEGSSNEAATALVSCASSHNSQQHHQSQQEQETSKSSEGQVPHQPTAPRFNQMIRKRARDGAPKQQWLKAGTGNGRMIKSKFIHDLPLIPLKNPSDGRVKNSVYDIRFEEVGLPIDPHLRLFVPL